MTDTTLPRVREGDTVILAYRKLGGYAPEHFREARRVVVERTTAKTFVAGGVRFHRTGVPYTRGDRHKWVDGFGHVWLEANHPFLCTATTWSILLDLTEGEDR